MEHIGYILFITKVELYFRKFGGETGDPFEAKFYILQEEAIAKKSELEEMYGTSVNLVKVKRTVKIVH